jgi:hypothetical protein
MRKAMLAAAAAATLLLAACGGDDSGSTAESVSSGSVAATQSTQASGGSGSSSSTTSSGGATTTEASGGGSGNGGGSGGPAFCSAGDDLEGNFDSFAGIMSGAVDPSKAGDAVDDLYGAFTNTKLFDQIASEAPAEIKDDVHTVVAKLEDAVKQLPPKSELVAALQTAQSDPAGFEQKLEAFMKPITDLEDDAEFAAADQHITDWTDAHCPS